jgi:hypothetical protein
MPPTYMNTNVYNPNSDANTFFTEALTQAVTPCVVKNCNAADQARTFNLKTLSYHLISAQLQLTWIQ